MKACQTILNCITIHGRYLASSSCATSLYPINFFITKKKKTATVNRSAQPSFFLTITNKC